MIDIRIVNAQVIDFEKMEFVNKTIAIKDGIFVEDVGGAKVEINGLGCYAVPSFIDTHVHYESSLVEPEQFATVLAKNGVTTAILDCHEIANVFGVKGIQKVLDEVAELKSDFYLQLPSCVPASENDLSPSIIRAKDLAKLIECDGVLGLGEVMNVPGVLAGDADLLAKIELVLKAGGIVDGHVPELDEKSLQKYAGYGITTNHECETIEMAKRTLRCGMYVQIREGSVAKNLDALLPLLASETEKVTFCTDDKTITDIVKEGSINAHVKRAIASGVDPIIAYKVASYNAAKCYRLNQGSFALGKKADFILLRDYHSVDIAAVYKGGERVDRLNQKLSQALYNKRAMFKESMQYYKTPDTTLPLTGGTIRTIEVVPNQLISREKYYEHGATKNFEGEAHRRLMKLLLVPRMLESDKVGKGIVSGCYFDGALVSTVSHDAHHLIALSNNDRDLQLALKTVNAIGGGIVFVCDGKVVEQLPLEIAGLTTEKCYEEAATSYAKVIEALLQSGFSGEFDPIIAMSFLALPVIPKLKLTLDGYFDIEKNKHVDLEVKRS